MKKYPFYRTKRVEMCFKNGEGSLVLKLGRYVGVYNDLELAASEIVKYLEEGGQSICLKRVLSNRGMKYWENIKSSSGAFIIPLMCIKMFYSHENVMKLLDIFEKYPRLKHTIENIKEDKQND